MYSVKVQFGCYRLFWILDLTSALASECEGGGERKLTTIQDTNNISRLRPPHISLLCLLSRSAGGSRCSLSSRELWQDGGFTQLSTGIEVTVGFERRGSSQTAGIRGLTHSRRCLAALGVVFPLLGIWPGRAALNIMLPHSATPLTRHKS